MKINNSKISTVKKKLPSTLRWYKKLKKRELKHNKIVVLYQKITPTLLDSVIFTHDFISTTKHAVLLEMTNYSLDLIIFMIRLLLM